MMTTALVVASACAISGPGTGAAAPPTAGEVMAQIRAEQVRATVDRLAGFGTRHTLSETESETRGVGAARRWMKAELERFGGADRGGLQVSFEEFMAPKGPRIPEPHPVANVVAVLPGSMPEAAGRRYYVVGHYDSMPSNVMDPNSEAPGANDDASGTTVVMEIARALAAVGPLESTVVLLCTVGEEQGLVGARYHAEQASARGDDVRAVLSNDIVGDPLGPGGDPSMATPHLIRVFSEGIPRNAGAQALAAIRNLAGEYDSPSRQLARYIAEVAEKEKTAVRPMLVFRPDRFLRGGDHSAFNEAGFAAVRFTEVHEDYRRQHQTPRTETLEDGSTVEYGDLPEHVDAEYLANVARLNAAVLVHLANAPSTPGNARIITARLEYTTTVRWDASPEPDVAGYEIVWRETTSPVWQHARDVGKVTEATVAESKDNSFFGVRAYDRDGYKSPVAFCGAARE